MTGWKDRGLCRGRNPDIWFAPASEALARAICRGCPVRAQCLALAAETGERHGVWGGLTASERDRDGPTVAERERQLILAEVADGASTVAELMERLGTARRRTKDQLRRLEVDGQVVITRQGSIPLRVVTNTRESS